MNIRRCYPVGVEVAPNGEVHFRLWAPTRKQLEAVIGNQRAIELSWEAGGSFSALIKALRKNVCRVFIPAKGAASSARPKVPVWQAMRYGPHEVTSPASELERLDS